MFLYFNKVKLISFFCFLEFFLFIFFIFSVQANQTDHLIISAVQITQGAGKTNHDFIEIYNPTEKDINLKGYRLVKRTKTGVSDTSIKSWTSDTFIKANNWRLWVSSDDSNFPNSVGADNFTKATLANDNGVALRKGSKDTGEIIDSLAWGSAENIFIEEKVFSQNPKSDESLVRKSDGKQDTDNNENDFEIISNFIPKNSADEEDLEDKGDKNNQGNKGNDENRAPIADAGGDMKIFGFFRS